MSFDNLMVGMSGVSRFSGQRGRTQDGLARSGIRYPSPFFDIGHTYLPPSMKALLRWCRYYYLTNPLINSTIHKMSEYPITEIVIDERDKVVKEKWEDLLGNHLRYRAFQIETGLDFFTYGLCAVTIHFPFDKYLICQSCKSKERASTATYKWRNLNYILNCKKCGHQSAAKVQDFYVRDVSRIRLMRWNPEYIHVEPAFAGADPVYTFEIPQQVRNDIILGKKAVLDTIPDVFIEAMKRNKFIRFAPDNLFVLKRPIISQKDEGWGMPLIFPVLKDTFYLQILRKAQEAIASEHIVPMRILFPQAGSATSDPYSTVSLDGWRNKVESEVAKWKYDYNYMPIMPLPIGNQTIGGDGKALGLYQEMEVWSKQIVNGMGVPYEFIAGGMQYSGSNVSMRMLENGFIGYRTDHQTMLNQFVIRRIANFMGWPVVRAHMKRFKMADDLQRSAFMFQLNQAQKISDQTLLAEVDQDYTVEKERKEKELEEQLEYQRKMQLGQAAIQAEVQAIQMRQQMEQQAEQQAQMQAMGMDPSAMGGDPAAGGAPQDPNAPPDGGGQTGQEGEMVPGQEVHPGMPENSTVSMENAQQAPNEGLPPNANPMTLGATGGGANLAYMAQRAFNAIKELDPMAMNQELQKLKGAWPQVYMLVIQRLQSEQGSQANPLNPLQSPLPEMKPTRRAASVGV